MMTVQTRLYTLMDGLVQTAKTSVKYLSDGILRIFKATDDNYPATGVQPFDGDIPEQTHTFG